MYGVFVWLAGRMLHNAAKTSGITGNGPERNRRKSHGKEMDILKARTTRPQCTLLGPHAIRWCFQLLYLKGHTVPKMENSSQKGAWVLDRLHQLSRLNSLLVIESWWFSAAPLVMWLLLEYREPQSLVSFKSLQSRQMCRKKDYLQYILCDNKQQQYVLRTYFWTVLLHLVHDKATWNWN